MRAPIHLPRPRLRRIQLCRPQLPVGRQLPRSRGLWSVDRIPPPIDGERTVAEASKEYFRLLFAGKNPTCGTCLRRGQIRGQKLTEEMAVRLANLVYEHLLDPGPRHLRQVLPMGGTAKSTKGSSDAPFLRHWDLLTKPKRGDYLLRRDGIDYVTGKLHSVPGKLWHYGSWRLGWSDEMVTIQEALGPRKGVLKRIERLLDERRKRSRKSWTRRRRKSLKMLDELHKEGREGCRKNRTRRKRTPG